MSMQYKARAPSAALMYFVSLKKVRPPSTTPWHTVQVKRFLYQTVKSLICALVKSKEAAEARRVTRSFFYNILIIDENLIKIIVNFISID